MKIKGKTDARFIIRVRKIVIKHRIALNSDTAIILLKSSYILPLNKKIIK